MKAYIYKKLLIPTGKYYIGQHNGKCDHYYGSGVDWKKDIKKYNADWNKDVITEILEFVEEEKDLNEREKYWLEYYDVQNNEGFYNKSNKPFGPLTHSDQTRSILSHKLKGMKRVGEALNNIRKGHVKRILIIDGEKISKSKTNHPCYKDPQRGLKISQSNKGRKHSLESNLKRSESLKGKTTKPKRIIKEFNSEMEFIREWDSVSSLIKFYRDNGLGFDYATFIKKQKNKQLYKNRYWL